MLIRQSRPDELDWVNQQYASIQFVLSSDEDFIAIAEVEGVRAGSGRIVKVEPSVAELGGMYVLPEFRGHSLAARIVEFLLLHSQHQTVYCIPFAPLEKFYGQFGFKRVDSCVSVPDPVKEKLAWCNNEAGYEQQAILMSQIRK